MTERKNRTADRLSALLLAGLLMLPMTACEGGEAKPAGTDTGTGTAAETDEGSTAKELILYVSPNGSDENDGSKDAPFATINGAKKAVRKLKKSDYTGITVEVAAGEYRISSLSFVERDGGTETCPITYRAAGEVVLNGGVSVPSDAFSPVTDPDMLARLSDDAKEHVYCVDLTKLGVTANDWGAVHAFGEYHTAAKYDGDYTGSLSCELFQNDRRLTTARYPNDGFLLTGDVISEGVGLESMSNPHVSNPRYYQEKNLPSDIYAVSDELASHISSWKTLDDVWMFGFWAYDWADAATPVGSFDAEKKELSPKFVSMFGAKKDAPYYFYNVFEELDMPGEWYLDRNMGVLYVYPEGDIADASFDLSLSADTLFTGENVHDLTLDGFTFKGTRGDAISITGSRNTVKNCLVKNIAGNAMTFKGNDNLITKNEITRTGRGGITVDGGDRETLTAGNNIVDNNYIHDWSEVYLTYQPAVALYGVGNVCSHNEMVNSPHEAIYYEGNNQIIEYNKIVHVCSMTSDAGAIYSGRRWSNYGNVVRYNWIEDLGTGDMVPCGIYWDDGLSGQSAYGNVLINIAGNPLGFGGGRDLNVYGNLILDFVHERTIAVSYDARAIEGITNNGWFTYTREEGQGLWAELDESPWKSEIWQKAYPEMTHFSFDFSDTDNPDFIPNPANSKLNGNVVYAAINHNTPLGKIADAVNKYSDLSGNACFVRKDYDADELFRDAENGDYHICEGSLILDEIPDYVDPPFEKMGRY